MLSNCRSLSRIAFTIIELLVVIAVIALLLAIILPMLSMAKEKSRRLVCKSNVKQFILATHVYANNYADRLPSGSRGNTPTLTDEIRDAMVKYSGDEKILICPWLGKPFNTPGGWVYREYNVIGYNYLGGHPDTPWSGPNEWISPQSTSDRSEMPLVTELNAWCVSEKMTFAPHGKRGAILEGGDACNRSANGIPSQEIGAEGGNIGLLDGSVSWKNIENMKVYNGGGCETAW